MDSQMDKWALCNKCYTPVKNNLNKALLTHCQHIFCYRCIDLENSECPKCKTNPISTMPLQKSLPKSLVPYFQPLSNQIKQVIRMAELQRIQGSIIISRFQEMINKYHDLKTVYLKGLEMAKTQVEGMKKIQDIIAVYEKRGKSEISANSSKKLHFPISLGRQNYNQQGQQIKIEQSYSPYSLPSGDTTNLKNEQRKLLAQKINSKWTTAMKSITKELRSNLQLHPQSAAFTPHGYQPRAILSDDSSQSPITPIHQRVRRAPVMSNDYLNSLPSESPNTPNYLNNSDYISSC